MKSFILVICGVCIYMIRYFSTLKTFRAHPSAEMHSLSPQALSIFCLRKMNDKSCLNPPTPPLLFSYIVTQELHSCRRFNRNLNFTKQHLPQCLCFNTQHSILKVFDHNMSEVNISSPSVADKNSN